MKSSRRFPALIAYLLPVVGWVYVWVFERKNQLASFHLRQSIGLFLFLAGVFAGWAAVAWLIAWIPYGVIFSMAIFGLVITALIFGLIAWLIGMVNALRGRMTPLPIFGGIAMRLPI